MNPSALGFQPLISLSGTFNWQPDGNNFHGSVIDGRNEYFNAGVAFTRRPAIDFVHLAIAKKVASWASVGVHGKRFVTRPGKTLSNGQSVIGYDVGNSMTLAIPLAVPIQIGIVADNLMHRKDGEVATGPRSYSSGIKLNINQLLMVYADYSQFFSHFRKSYNGYNGGIEVALAQDLFVRGGLFGFRQKGWAAGAGWVGPKVGLSYGYQNRREEQMREFEHAVTMDVFM